MATNAATGRDPVSDTPRRWLPQLLWLVISRQPTAGASTETTTARGAEAETQQTLGNWFEGVIDELCGLPWDRPDWSSENPKPLSMSAVAELTLILLDMMPNHATAPRISPNWDGGGMASWELGNLSLEIETAPHRPAQYSYVDEREGQNVGDERDVRGNEPQLRQWLHNVADVTAELNR